KTGGIPPRSGGQNGFAMVMVADRESAHLISIVALCYRLSGCNNWIIEKAMQQRVTRYNRLEPRLWPIGRTIENAPKKSEPNCCRDQPACPQICRQADSLRGRRR